MLVMVGGGRGGRRAPSPTSTVETHERAIAAGREPAFVTISLRLEVDDAAPENARVARCAIDDVIDNTKTRPFLSVGVVKVVGGAAAADVDDVDSEGGIDSLRHISRN